MRRKRQFGVDVDTERSDVERRCDAAVLQWNLDRGDIAELLPRTDPDKLSLI